MYDQVMRGAQHLHHNTALSSTDECSVHQHDSQGPVNKAHDIFLRDAERRSVKSSTAPAALQWSTRSTCVMHQMPEEAGTKILVIFIYFSGDFGLDQERLQQTNSLPHLDPLLSQISHHLSFHHHILQEVM